MTVETDEQYQEIVEAYFNTVCQLKQIYDLLYISIILCRLKKGHYNMAIPDVEEAFHVSSYTILVSMGFDTGISYGFAKIRSATLMGDIVNLYQCNNNMMKYFHQNKSMDLILKCQIMPPRDHFKKFKGQILG